ncbi:hypothetical protein NDU88_000430 [Pleurodeles waltl]|uniref:Uncharacterized protein n=1 Tax=Pleurodeles waltl TaxID=8319 RepID=A0AAV7URN1_PLEWA|nr:hypothetical protein NDU88_000430 [Pleurodeles waltl]
MPGTDPLGPGAASPRGAWGPGMPGTDPLGPGAASPRGAWGPGMPGTDPLGPGAASPRGAGGMGCLAQIPWVRGARLPEVRGGMGCLAQIPWVRGPRLPEVLGGLGCLAQIPWGRGPRVTLAPIPSHSLDPSDSHTPLPRAVPSPAAALHNCGESLTLKLFPLNRNRVNPISFPSVELLINQPRSRRSNECDGLEAPRHPCDKERVSRVRIHVMCVQSRSECTIGEL